MYWKFVPKLMVQYGCWYQVYEIESRASYQSANLQVIILIYIWMLWLI